MWRIYQGAAVASSMACCSFCTLRRAKGKSEAVKPSADANCNTLQRTASVPNSADLLPLITIHDGVEVFFRHRLIQHRLRLRATTHNDTTIAAWSFPPGWSSHHQLRALMPQQCLLVVRGMRMLCGRWKAFLIASSLYSSRILHLYLSMLSWRFLKF